MRVLNYVCDFCGRYMARVYDSAYHVNIAEEDEPPKTVVLLFKAKIEDQADVMQTQVCRECAAKTIEKIKQSKEVEVLNEHSKSDT